MAEQWTSWDPDPACRVFQLHGSIDPELAGRLRQQMIDRPTPRTVVDVRSAVLDDSVLGVLVGALKRARAADNEIVVVGRLPNGLHKLFRTYDSLTRAVADGGDDDGSAGVREPRRPTPAGGAGHLELPLP